MNRLFFDLEADGLIEDASVIWCTGTQLNDQCVIVDRGTPWSKLTNADMLIGHNIIGYDLPLIKKLEGWSPRDNVIIRDTYLMSCLFYGTRLKSHSLKAWGQRLGEYKGDFTDFSRYSEEMAGYCAQDVKVMRLTYNYLCEKMGIEP